MITKIKAAAGFSAIARVLLGSRPPGQARISSARHHKSSALPRKTRSRALPQSRRLRQAVSATASLPGTRASGQQPRAMVTTT